MMIKQKCRYELGTPLPAHAIVQQAWPEVGQNRSLSAARSAGELTQADIVAAIATSKSNEHIAKTGRWWRQVRLGTISAIKE